MWLVSISERSLRKGSMDWEERLMGAMSGCAGWALHNSTGATVPSMVAVAVEKG